MTPKNLGKNADRNMLLKSGPSNIVHPAGLRYILNLFLNTSVLTQHSMRGSKKPPLFSSDSDRTLLNQ